MSKFFAAVAVVAAGVAGWLAFETTCLRCEVERQRDRVEELRARLDVGAGRVAPVRDPADLRASVPAATEVESAEPSGTPTLAPVSLEPEAMARRIAALESQLAKQAEGVAALEKKVESGGGSNLLEGVPSNFFHDVNAAARSMKLDDRQKSDLERIVEGTKRELADLRALPNDEGVTWTEAGKVKFEGSGDGMIAFGANFAKLEAFKKGKIPGSSETYGEADKRIRSRAKERARSLLTPEQQKTWDKAHVDPLFGGGGDAFAISFATAGEVIQETDAGR